jgi:hypothetical protein
VARSLTSMLYRAARLSGTARAVTRSASTASLCPVGRRAGNIVKGRLLARAGIWRRL